MVAIKLVIYCCCVNSYRNKQSSYETDLPFIIFPPARNCDESDFLVLHDDGFDFVSLVQHDLKSKRGM
jgi:hypothetical protein